MAATREEIQQHLDELNAAWQRYDGLVRGAILPRNSYEKSNEMLEENRKYMAALTWLCEHGIPDMPPAMTYNPNTLTFSIAPDTLATVTST